MNGYDDTIVLKNVLTADDIKWLFSVKEQLRTDPESHKPRMVKDGRSNNVYNMTDKTVFRDEQMHEWIAKFLPFDPDEYEFYGVNFYDLQVPYALHTDTSPVSFYQGIIPMSIEPEVVDTHTVIFDQTAEENVEWIAPAYNKPDDYKPFYNKGIRDPNYFGGWTDEYKISEEALKRHWVDHWDFWKEAYKGFSIKCEYKWNIGDIFIFDSKFAHCATNLHLKGIAQKTGLLFILNRKVS